MSTGLEDIRKFRGKPWSAWTDFIGFKVPPELTENSATKVTNECQSMLLNKSDIPIFGHCPTAEILELAICNFCGDKLKLPALLDHINTRHEETKSKTTVQESSTNIINDKINDDNCRNNNANKSPRKSTQQRYAHTKLNKECNKFNNNNKALSLSNGKCNANNLTSHHHHLSSSDITANGRPLLQVQVHLERSKLAQKLTNCKELGRTETTRSVTSLHDYKLKQIQLKLNKNKDEKNENASPVQINSTSIQSNAVTSGQTRINIVSAEQNKPSNNNISSSSSSSLMHSNRKACILKDRTVTNKESDSKKVNSRQTSISETSRINELQAAKEISENVNQSKPSASDVPSTPLADSGVTSNTQQQKKGINQPSLFASKEERKNFATSKSSQRRTGMGCTLRDRTYNPEKHCGVLAKENAKPCTRSLTCKTHSITLRRAVTGRSKSFDVLLADHRKDKEMSRVSAGNNCASIITTERNSAGNNIQHKSIPQVEEPLKVEPKIERGNQVVAAHRTDNPTLDIEKKLHFSLPVSIRPKEILETKLKNNNNIDHSHSNKDSHNSKGNVTDNDVAKKMINEINGISKSEITSVCTDLSSRSVSANSLSQINSTNNQSSKESSIDVDKRTQASEQTDRQQTNVQFLANRQCHPLWRRNRGLLYTTPTKFPRLTDRLILQNVTEINTAQMPSSGQIDTSNSTCLLQAVEQCTKALLATSSAPARPTFIEQQPKKSIELRTNLPADDTNSCPTKRAIPNTIYFSNSNSTLGAKKMRLQDGNQLCILGPLKSAANSSVVLQETQNDASIANDRRPVVQVSINSIIGRNFMPASSTNPDPQLVARLPGNSSAINLLPSTSVSPHRIHYISASGPIPLALRPVAIVPQVT